jgi:peptide/nickel transport system substrate-binding protein
MSGWERIDDKTFRLRLKGAYGLVLDSLAKPDTYVPFILPKRLASTPASSQISDATGSGPFIFKKDEWSPGERVVYVRNPKYKPRNEPASGTAGGKVVKVDRVEWRILKDPQSQVNALIAGEVDIVVEPAFTLYPLLQASPGIQMVTTNPLGYFFFLRFNHVQKPFNDARIRQAAMVAMNQTEFLQAQVGLPEMFHTCFSIYPCATPLTSTEGMDFLIKPDIVRARQLLREAGYDGTPAIIMQPTDHSSLNKLPAVAAQTLREAGFNVVLESMDWNTLQARRVKETGWSIFPGLGSLWTRAIPVSANVLNPLCEKAWFGWPCDPDLERLRDAFAFAQSDEDRKRIATQVQVRAMQVGTHVPLGEYRTKLAARKDVRGFVTAPINAFWNLEKQ